MKADNPHFMIAVALNTAEKAVREAHEILEKGELGPAAAANMVRIAMENLSRIAYELTMAQSRKMAGEHNIFCRAGLDKWLTEKEHAEKRVLKIARSTIEDGKDFLPALSEAIQALDAIKAADPTKTKPPEVVDTSKPGAMDALWD